MATKRMISNRPSVSEIKEAVKSMGGRFVFNRDNRPGNNWNSTVTGLSIYRDKLYVDGYDALSSTDSDFRVPADDFFRGGTHSHEVWEERLRGREHHVIRYSENEKNSIREAFAGEYNKTIKKASPASGGAGAKASGGAG